MSVKNFTTSVANDGIMLKPYLVSSVESRNGKLLEEGVIIEN